MNKSMTNVEKKLASPLELVIKKRILLYGLDIKSLAKLTNAKSSNLIFYIQGKKRSKRAELLICKVLDLDYEAIFPKPVYTRVEPTNLEINY